MIKVLVTQRVDVIPSYGERRDALDQRWVKFLVASDIFPVIAPNNMDCISFILENDKLDGVLLTGGGDIESLDGNCPERDQVEKYILEWAMRRDVPLIGVCRGMQLIQDFFGIELKRVEGHINNRFRLNVNFNNRISSLVDGISDVNSYHQFGAYETKGDLVTVASSSDGVVMAVEHISKSVFGIMWHSEREEVFLDKHARFFQKIYRKQV